MINQLKSLEKLMRYLLILLAGSLLIGCKTTEQRYGSGQLVLDKRVTEVIEKYYYVERLQHLEFAIDRQGRNLSARYCSSGGGNCFESTGIESIASCNKSGSFDCGIFMIDSRVVWNGPTLSRRWRHGAMMPFSGDWSFSFRTGEEAFRESVLQARLGRFSFPDTGALAGCIMALDQTGPAFGTFRLSCQDGRFSIGRFAAPPSMVVRGSGTDQDNEPFSFRFDLSAGTGAIYLADLTGERGGRSWLSAPSTGNLPSSSSNPSAL